MKVKQYSKTTVCFCLVGLLLFPALSWADGGESGQKKRANSLEPGSWSIQFQITDHIGLKPFNGKIISVKRHFSEKSAFRVGLNLDLDADDSENNSTSTYADTVINTSTSIKESNRQSVQLNFLYMRYPNPGRNINLFLGAGPLVRFSRSNSEQESTYIRSTPTQQRTQRSTSTAWSRTWAIGALGAAGVEWFAKKGISFHAEYRVSMDYSKTTSESERIDHDDPKDVRTADFKSDGWNFDGVNVTLGISLYF